MKTSLLAALAPLAIATTSAATSFCDSDADFEQVFRDDFDTFNETTWSKTVGNEIGVGLVTCCSCPRGMATHRLCNFNTHTHTHTAAPYSNSATRVRNLFVA